MFEHFCSEGFVYVCETDVYGAAQQWSSLQSFADDTMKISGSFLQLVHLRHATSEVHKTFGGAAAGQCLVWAVQPQSTQETNDKNAQEI